MNIFLTIRLIMHLKTRTNIRYKKHQNIEPDYEIS